MVEASSWEIRNKKVNIDIFERTLTVKGRTEIGRY